MSKEKLRCLLLVLVLGGMMLPGCSSSDEPEGEDFVDLLESGGLTRAYVAYVPASYRDNRPTPLVIAFHGVPGSGEGLRRFTRLDDLADRMGWIIVYPNATSDWAEGCDGCARSDREGVDDVQFVADLIAALAERLNVDARRVYAVGYSQGGLFTQRLACDLADEVAAVAVVAATMSVPLSRVCAPEQAVSVMMVHGKSDAVFPWDGGNQGNFATLGVQDAARLWAERNACTIPPQRIDEPGGTQGADVDLEAYTDCTDGTEVALYGITDGSHDWPQAFDVNGLIGTFLARHAR